MKKYYRYGEMILALREEYQECRKLLDELNDCVNIKTDYSDFYFTGLLSYDDKIQDLSDRKIKLVVEKRYLDILKKVQYLKHDWYGQFLYIASFVADKKDNGLYGLKYNDISTPVDKKKYIPEVEVINQTKFSELVDELFSSDLMQLRSGYFKNNHDIISLDFGSAYISTSLGDNSFITWNGIQDYFNYSITRHNSPALIENILSLEIPADKISSDWLKLLEKHENIFDNNLLFNVDINAQSKKGILEISDIEDKHEVKLLKQAK
jgi:hypothetical protein